MYTISHIECKPHGYQSPETGVLHGSYASIADKQTLPEERDIDDDSTPVATGWFRQWPAGVEEVVAVGELRCDPNIAVLGRSTATDLLEQIVTLRVFSNHDDRKPPTTL